MAIELTWLGHASWMIKTGTTEILLDPFLNDSPTSPVKSHEVKPDFILVSHGHFDHIADVESIARANQSHIVAIHEIAEWYGKKDLTKRTGMNIGGVAEFDFGSVRMTPALHSSSFPDGSYAGCPAGFLLQIDQKKIYFACDTGLFSDMKLIGDYGIDLAVLPIGDLYTMGPDESVAATKLLSPKQVLPTHYNTWPPIEQDARQWADAIRTGTISEPIILDPGQSHKI